MLHYLIHLARESVESFAAPSLPKLSVVQAKEDHPASDAGSGEAEGDKENRGDSNSQQEGSSGAKGRGGAGNKGKQSGTGTEGGSAGAGGHRVARFESGRTLSDHPDRITFQARMAGGQLAVIKAYYTAAGRDLEVARFRQLRGLTATPEVLEERLELEWVGGGGDDRRVHSFVLAWVGPEDVGGPRWGGRAAPALPARALAQTREALAAMHRRGVAHGDVREENLAWDAAAGRVYVLDLSHAATRKGAGADAAEFDRQRAEDLYRVERLFEEAVTPGAPAARMMR